MAESLELLACTEEEYQIPAGEPVRGREANVAVFSEQDPIRGL